MNFQKLFPMPKPLIGVIHLPPLPGHIGSPGIAAVTQKALKDLKTLTSVGFDGVLVENDGDDPPYFESNERISKGFGEVMKVLRANTSLPLGLEILYDMPGTIELAALVNADFVRLDVFVDDVQHARGPIIKAKAAELDSIRQKRKPELLLLTDVQVKHTTMLDTAKSIAQSTQDAVAAGSDGIIITGSWTGQEPSFGDIGDAKLMAGTVPVLVGSGISAKNVENLLPLVDGIIVASSLKTYGHVDPAKAGELVKLVKDGCVRDNKE